MNAEPQHPLFRAEVLEAKRTRLEGEIVLTQPLQVQGLVLLLIALIAAVGAWISLGQYSRTETARGILVTDESLAKIVAMRPGQVTELLVKEGDLVKPGQRLASIQIEQTGETGGSAVGESLAAVEAQRGLAERQVRLAGQRAQSERSRIAASLAGMRQQRADLAGQIELQQQVVASAQETFERIGAVVEKGFISRREVERRQQAWLAARQDLGRLQQQSNSLAAEERRAAAELERIAADSGSEVAAALSSAQGLVQLRARLGSERAYTIAAPIVGRVTAIEVARLACIHHDIEAMPLRYDTLVGDMGSALSGGQKQRVLLARALYPNPAVLFIDEGTAHLDPASERQVIEALSALPITRIVSAHRPLPIEQADRVLSVAGGRIAAARAADSRMKNGHETAGSATAPAPLAPSIGVTEGSK